MRLLQLFVVFMLLLPCVFGIAISLRFLAMPLMTDGEREEARAYALEHGVTIYAPNQLDQLLDWCGLFLTSVIGAFLSILGLVTTLRDRRPST